MELKNICQSCTIPIGECKTMALKKMGIPGPGANMVKIKS
jgi:hypothetical protein